MGAQGLYGSGAGCFGSGVLVGFVFFPSLLTRTSGVPVFESVVPQRGTQASQRFPSRFGQLARLRLAGDGAWAAFGPRRQDAGLGFRVEEAEPSGTDRVTVVMRETAIEVATVPSGRRGPCSRPADGVAPDGPAATP